MRLSRSSTRCTRRCRRRFWHCRAFSSGSERGWGGPAWDTLKGSRHANIKELRLSAAGGEWRVAFAFDPKRKAILLVAGDKSGVSERRFYRELIRKDDDRFDTHLARPKRGRT